MDRRKFHDEDSTHANRARALFTWWQGATEGGRATQIHSVYRLCHGDNLEGEHPKHAVITFLLREGESGTELLMLQRRTEASCMAGQWFAPGGKLHKCESWRLAATRETKEETDVDVDAAEWIVSWPTNGDVAVGSQGGDWRVRDFAVRVQANTEAKHSTEHRALEWMTLEQIGELPAGQKGDRLEERARAATEAVQIRELKPPTQMPWGAEDIQQLLDEPEEDLGEDDETPQAGGSEESEEDDDEPADPLAGVEQAQHTPGEDEDADSDLSDTPGGGGAHSQGEQSQGEEPDPNMMFDIDSDGQAWAIDTECEAAMGAIPVGEPGEYTAEHVNPELAGCTQQMRQTLPHPDMTPCTVCYGIMGEGTCRRDEQCEIQEAVQEGRCPSCRRAADECTDEPCTRGLEMAIAFMESARRHLEPARFRAAIPQDAVEERDWADAERTTRGLLRGVSRAKVSEIWDNTEWPVERVLAVDKKRRVATVEGVGSTWEVPLKNAPRQALAEYYQRVERDEAEETQRRAEQAEAEEAHRAEQAAAEEARQRDEQERERRAEAAAARPKLSASEVLDMLARKGHEHKRATSQARAGTNAAQGAPPQASPPRRPRTNGPGNVTRPTEFGRANRGAPTQQNQATDQDRTESRMTDQERMMQAMLQQMEASAATIRHLVALNKGRDGWPGRDEASSSESDDGDDDALITKEAAKLRHSIMAALLDALRLSRADLDLRPALYHCVTAAGYETIYPFRRMIGLPMAMDLEGMLDENAATAAIRSTEARELQAARKDDATTTLESGKGGRLQMVTGRKPKLSKPKIVKEIRTQNDLICALYSLAHHYGNVGEQEMKRLVEEHTASMRNVWHQGALMGRDESLIELDKALRYHRCREGKSDTWKLDQSPSSDEAVILSRAIAAAQIASVAANSKRPGKGQPAAKGGSEDPEDDDTCRLWRETGQCRFGDRCRYKHPKTQRGTRTDSGAAGKGGAKGEADSTKPPNEFFRKALAAGICAQYAWRKQCPRAPNEDHCLHKKTGTDLKHTCLNCEFKKGEHDIEMGSCPH